MIDILLVLLLLFIVSNLVSRSDDTLSPENTLCLKGLLCILVVLHHISQHVTTGNFFNYLIFMGRYAVATFFFLSGYSLCTQVSRSRTYLRTFLPKRLGKILIPYVVIAIVYAVVRSRLFGSHYSLDSILRSFPKYDTIIANGWFMISIIVFYMFFYISFLLFLKRHLAIILCTILVSFYTVFQLCSGFSFHWYNANLAFPLGLIWSCHKTKFEQLRNRYPQQLLLSTTVILFFWHNYPLFETALHIPFRLSAVLYTNLAAISFVILLMSLLPKIKLQNKFFRFFGSISMELYLIHGLIILLFQNHASSNARDLLFAIQVFGFSIPTALAFHQLFKRMNRFIYRRQQAKA